MTEAETPLAMMDQIIRLAPAELLSADGAEGLFASFEADRDLGWDRSNLTFELVEHPRRALKWAMVAAAAERYVADLEIGIKNLRAQLDARTRTTFVEASAKFTEAMVAASIIPVRITRPRPRENLRKGRRSPFVGLVQSPARRARWPETEVRSFEVPCARFCRAR